MLSMASMNQESFRFSREGNFTQQGFIMNLSCMRKTEMDSEYSKTNFSPWSWGSPEFGKQQNLATY